MRKGLYALGAVVMTVVTGFSLCQDLNTSLGDPVRAPDGGIMEDWCGWDVDAWEAWIASNNIFNSWALPLGEDHGWGVRTNGTGMSAFPVCGRMDGHPFGHFQWGRVDEELGTFQEAVEIETNNGVGTWDLEAGPIVMRFRPIQSDDPEMDPNAQLYLFDYWSPTELFINIYRSGLTDQFGVNVFLRGGAGSDNLDIRPAVHSDHEWVRFRYDESADEIMVETAPADPCGEEWEALLSIARAGAPLNNLTMRALQNPNYSDGDVTVTVPGILGVIYQEVPE